MEQEQPVPTNPLALARQELHITQQELADLTGTTQNFIQRAENGEYPHPPKPLLEYFSGGDSTNSERLTGLYSAFQSLQREHSYGYLTPNVKWVDAPTGVTLSGATLQSSYLPGPEHPLYWWFIITATDYGESRLPTIYGVSKAFCVHQAVIEKWYKNPKTVRRVPDVLKSALFSAGYSDSLLINLEAGYELYRRQLLGE